LLDQLRSNCEGCSAGFSTNEFCSGNDISPLIRSSHLHQTVLFFPEIVKIVALNQLITEFGKRHSGFTFKSFLYRIFGHHVIHSNMLTYITNKIQKTKIPEPIVVINHFGTIGTAVEVEKFLKLICQASHIMVKYIFREKITFGRLSGRITHHSGSTTHQSNRFVTGTLEMNQGHNLS